MNRLSLALAAVLLAAPAAAIEREQRIHTTPPSTPHPWPQGAPWVVVNGTSHAPFELRYGEVDGRRVLIEPHTGEVIYVLLP